MVISWIPKAGCALRTWGTGRIKIQQSGSYSEELLFEVQVCVHLARFLQPYQVQFVSLAEEKAVGTFGGAQDTYKGCSGCKAWSAA